ncbi:MAG: multicopper oxidase family protein [Gemmatimonadaceae bacterium]
MSDTLRLPPTLVNLSTVPGVVEVNLTASPAQLALNPGHPTEAYAYNGSVPGPTLDVHEGDRVTIHFRNNLPEKTTIHWHGLHIPAVMDGSPMTPIEPGKSFDYSFTIPRGTAGTYWYHPHPDLRTGYQIAKGLFGAIIVRDANDPLPASLPEKLLILADNRFNPDGSPEFSTPGTPQGIADEVNGREGDILTVNGQVMPTIPIRSGEIQRWRVINVSAARIYTLALPNQALLHVGGDGGLFEQPIKAKSVRVASSERVELLVRGTGSPGASATLQSLPYDRYDPHTRPTDWQVARSLLTLQYSEQPPVAAVVLPATLRHVPPLDTSRVTVRREIVLSQGLINGRVMDMRRVNETATLGATEIWTIENVVAMDHPFHLHGFSFQVLDRNGVTEPFREWKDVVNVPKHESVRFVVRFDDFPGMWMYHCHILDHEDHGMMAMLNVRPPTVRRTPQ